MRVGLFALLLTACDPGPLPPGDAFGWPNVPNPGLYAVEDAGGDDGCALRDPLLAPEVWALTLRDTARDAFAFSADAPDGGAATLQCGYHRPGLICFESDLGTWLTGDRELAVWMDGQGTSVSVALHVEALETCASGGGGCSNPCTSSFDLTFERTIQ